MTRARQREHGSNVADQLPLAVQQDQVTAPRHRRGDPTGQGRGTWAPEDGWAVHTADWSEVCRLQVRVGRRLRWSGSAVEVG